MAVELPVRAGDPWRNDQAGKRGGWIARVLRVTPPSVELEVVRGPSRSLTCRHREPGWAFLHDVKPRRPA